jgi:hypothetical protein
MSLANIIAALVTTIVLAIIFVPVSRRLLKGAIASQSWHMPLFLRRLVELGAWVGSGQVVDSVFDHQHADFLKNHGALATEIRVFIDQIYTFVPEERLPELQAKLEHMRLDRQQMSFEDFIEKWGRTVEEVNL